MRSRSTLLAAALVAAVMLAPSVARASLVIYNDEASYLAAITNPGVDTFNDLPLAAFSSPLNRTAGSYGYTVSAAGGFFGAGSSSDVWLSTANALNPIVFSNFSTDVRGVGGFFFGSNSNGGLFSGQSVVVTATDASGSLSQTLTNAMTSTFLGFVSTGPITSLSVAALQSSSSVFVWPTVNNLTLGAAATVNPIPEPSSLVAMGTGALTLLVARRLRRRSPRD